MARRKTEQDFKYTAEELQARIDAYFAKCEAENLVPLWEELLPAIPIGKRAWEKYREGIETEEESEAHRAQRRALKEVVDMTTLRLTAGLIRAVHREPKNSATSIFLMKQKAYGGYTDMPQGANEAPTLKIHLMGVGTHAGE